MVTAAESCQKSSPRRCCNHCHLSSGGHTHHSRTGSLGCSQCRLSAKLCCNNGDGNWNRASGVPLREGQDDGMQDWQAKKDIWGKLRQYGCHVVLLVLFPGSAGMLRLVALPAVTASWRGGYRGLGCPDRAQPGIGICRARGHLWVCRACSIPAEKGAHDAQPS